MNSPMNEDPAWLRVQDLQREAENRRLVVGLPSFRMAAAIRRLAAGTRARVISRKVVTASVARPNVETRRSRPA